MKHIIFGNKKNIKSQTYKIQFESISFKLEHYKKCEDEFKDSRYASIYLDTGKYKSSLMTFICDDVHVTLYNDNVYFNFYVPDDLKTNHSEIINEYLSKLKSIFTDLKYKSVQVGIIIKCDTNSEFNNLYNFQMRIKDKHKKEFLTDDMFCLFKLIIEEKMWQSEDDDNYFGMLFTHFRRFRDDGKIQNEVELYYRYNEEYSNSFSPINVINLMTHEIYSRLIELLQKAGSMYYNISFYDDDPEEDIDEEDWE